MRMPDWLDPLTLRWLADEEERVMRREQKAIESLVGPDWEKFPEISKGRLQYMKRQSQRYRIIATRVETKKKS